jgi:putative hemolysin
MNKPPVIYRKEELPTADFSLVVTKPWLKKIIKLLQKPLNYLVGIPILEEHNCAIANDQSPISTWEKWLRRLNIDIKILNDSIKQVPITGRLIIVSNHPFGMLDGLVLCSLIKQIRPDIKVMANQILLSGHAINQDIIGVDPYSHGHAKKINSKPLRNALDWLNQDHLLAIFPSGDVSRLSKAGSDVDDPPWSRSVGKFILKSKAPVLPVYFHGQNSSFFYRIARFNERIATLLLPREFLRKQNTTVHLQFGKIISAEEIAQQPDPERLIELLRNKTYSMRNHHE